MPFEAIRALAQRGIRKAGSTTLLWACLISPSPLLSENALNWIVQHMISDENLRLSSSCLEGAQSSDAQACTEAMNAEIRARYGDTSDRILSAYAKVGAITLPSSLDCGGIAPLADDNSQAPIAGLTREPISLAYWMAPPGASQQHAEMDKLNSQLGLARHPDPALTEALVRLALGRGSPHDYKRAVERLACLNPSQFTNPADAHELLEAAGLGVDCSGAVQIMIRHLLGTNDNKSLGLNPSLVENFARMRQREAKHHFSYSDNPLRLRPGDIVTLDATVPNAVGHVVMVQDTRFEIAKPGGFGEPGDALMRVRVASSWGGRGAAIETWVYDLATRQWATLSEDGTYQPTPHGPYDHYYTGHYRSKLLP